MRTAFASKELKTFFWSKGEGKRKMVFMVFFDELGECLNVVQSREVLIETAYSTG